MKGVQLSAARVQPSSNTFSPEPQGGGPQTLPGQKGGYAQLPVVHMGNDPYPPHGQRGVQSQMPGGPMGADKSVLSPELLDDHERFKLENKNQKKSPR